VVDLRSDTVTRPTEAMRRAMAAAEVGDDAYGEDPTVNALQELVAERLGLPAALFVPSGTMANQLALRTLAAPGTLIVAGRNSHVVAFENGAGAYNTGAQFHVVADDGPPSAADLQWVIDAADHHRPVASVCCVENTHMASAGAVIEPAALDAVAATARAGGLAVHLDGARLWNAEVASGVPVATWASSATTVMCCLSKGLGAPVGSLLAGPAEIIDRARRHRQRLGGAMRQAGIVAAAGLVALRDGFDHLAEDHRRAGLLAEAVADRWPGATVRWGGTNLVTFTHADPAGLLDRLAAAGVRAGTLAPGVVRLVTHRDVDDEGLERARRALRDG